MPAPRSRKPSGSPVLFSGVSGRAAPTGRAEVGRLAAGKDETSRHEPPPLQYT